MFALTAPRRLIVLAVMACRDSVTEPRSLVVTLDRAAQYAGEVVTLVSPAFRNLVLEPLSGAVPPTRRWFNFAVLMAGDTTDSWRTGSDSIAFRVPALYTGSYEVEIKATGFDSAAAILQVVGQAYPPYGTFHAYTNTITGARWPTRGLVVMEEVSWPGFTTGYGLIDAQSRQLTMIPELSAVTPDVVRMYVPGPSYRPNHFVFDVSPGGAGVARVWQLAPTVRLVDSIPCTAPGTAANYTAADIAPGVCLLARANTIIRNGTDTLVPPHLTYREAEFRMAPGGEWTVPRTQLQFPSADTGPIVWPVVSDAGTVVHTIDTLRQVTGAAFSATGDTLFVTAGVFDATHESSLRWTLVALDAATGATLASRAFPSGEALQDVLVDPVQALVYVASRRLVTDALGSTQPRQHLTILDRITLSSVATIVAAWPAAPGHASVVYGGSSSRVHVFAWCGFDCGGVHDYAFDIALPQSPELTTPARSHPRRWAAGSP